MKALVTGANGFLGCQVVKQLLQLCPKAEIRAMVRHNSSLNELEGLDIEIFRGSLNSPQRVKDAVDDIDTLIHMAAAMAGSPPGMFIETVVATENLFNALDANAIKKIVFVSSFSVYDAFGLKSGSVVDENTPLEPHPELRDAYAWCKYWQEKFCREKAKEMGINLITIRPGVIYGKGRSMLSHRLGERLPGLQIYLAIGKKSRLPLTYVENCAEAVVKACLNETIQNEVFNIVDDETPTQKVYLKKYTKLFGRIKRKVTIPYWMYYTMCWFGELLHKQTKGNFPLVFSRYKAAMYKPFRYSNEKVKKVLDWKPKVTLDEALQEYYQLSQKLY